MIFISGIISMIIQRNTYVQIKFVWFIFTRIRSIFYPKKLCFLFLGGNCPLSPPTRAPVKAGSSRPFGQVVIVNRIYYYKWLLLTTTIKCHKAAKQSNHLNNVSGTEFSCAFKLGLNSFYHSTPSLYLKVAF